MLQCEPAAAATVRVFGWSEVRCDCPLLLLYPCRCTALEQERNDLKEKVSDLSQAVADSNLAKTELKQQLKSTSADRDEAVRHNLKLQSKLSSLEDDYSGLIQVNKEAMRELDESRAQVDKLNKEAGQLSALVEKLENRCASHSSQGVCMPI